MLFERKRRGSLMKLAPTLRSWPRPPLPTTCQEKSSRNCHFFCCVCCGVFTFWPTVTRFGNDCCRSVLFAVIAFAKSAYWKMNSFSLAPPTTQLWFRLIELNLFVLVPQLFCGVVDETAYGCEFWLYP